MKTTVDTINHNALLFALGMLILLLATGCASQVRPVQEGGERLEALQQISASRDENRVKDMSHDELLARGQSYAATGNNRLARLHFSTALQKRPESIPALMGMGNLSRNQGENVLAGEYFNRVLEQEPDNFRAMTAMGIIHRERNEFSRAEEYLTRALEIRGEDPRLLSELAIVYDNAGREAEAEPLFRKVTEMRPNSALAWNNLGFNYMLQEKYEPAVEALRQAMQLAPQDKLIINNLAMAMALNGEEDRAFNLLVRSVGEAGAYNNLGYIFMTTGQFDKAEEAFQKALEKNTSYYVRARENLDRINILRDSARQ